MNVSLAKWSPCLVVVFSLLSGMEGSGCLIDERNNSSAPFGPGLSLPTCPFASQPVTSVSIDTGALLTTQAGMGVGVFVDYAAGGHWRISTVCDTALSHEPCTFDVTAQVIGGTVASLAGENLEAEDTVGSTCPDTAYLAAQTSSDFDSLLFDAPPGATVRVTAALGGAIYPDLIYWTGGGVAHHDDVHANPLGLTPSAP